jgi:multiple sugar transport system permease protein
MKGLGKKTAPYRYLMPTLILMAIFMVIPICIVIGYSFMDKAVVSKNPAFVGLDNYKELLSNSDYWGSVSNTIIFVVVSVVAHMILGMLQQELKLLLALFIFYHGFLQHL